MQIQENEIELRKYTIFIGNNNSGKTSIINRLTHDVNFIYNNDVSKQLENIEKLSKEWLESLNLSYNELKVNKTTNCFLNLIEQVYLKVDKPTMFKWINPEAFLYPSNLQSLIELLIEQNKDNNKKFIIETHSELIQLVFQLFIAKQEINQNDVIIYYIKRVENNSLIFKIEVNELGQFSFWPEHNTPFDEIEDLTLDLIAARQRRKGI